LSVRFETALFRIPVLIEGTSYLFGVAVVAVAGVLSALAIRGRIAHMDLVEVLKARE
jgi:putative ABC transport system permease protein